jgi:hypothetical protein
MQIDEAACVLSSDSPASFSQQIESPQMNSERSPLLKVPFGDRDAASPDPRPGLASKGLCICNPVPSEFTAERALSEVYDLTGKCFEPFLEHSARKPTRQGSLTEGGDGNLTSAAIELAF